MSKSEARILAEHGRDREAAEVAAPRDDGSPEADDVGDAGGDDEPASSAPAGG